VGAVAGVAAGVAGATGYSTSVYLDSNNITYNSIEIKI
jgi:uncharacterized OsmC-like protein